MAASGALDDSANSTAQLYLRKGLTNFCMARYVQVLWAQQTLHAVRQWRMLSLPHRPCASTSSAPKPLIEKCRRVLSPLGCSISCPAPLTCYCYPKLPAQARDFSSENMDGRLCSTFAREETRRATPRWIRGSAFGRGAKPRTSRSRKRQRTGRTLSAAYPHDRGGRRSSRKPTLHHPRSSQTTACRHPGSTAQ